MNNEKHMRSAIKSVLWRVVGVIILALVTYGYTRSWVQTGWVTFLHHGVFLFVFYIHERFWQHVDFKNLLARSVMKCITYETILGTLILGIITLIITGNAQQMTQITITYIGIKHIVFVLNEFMWNKIKVGLINDKGT